MWELLVSQNIPFRPWWARNFASSSSTEPPPFTDVAFFSLCHVEHAIKLKAEILADSASHRHAQRSKPLPHFSWMSPYLWIFQLYTANSSFHIEKGQEVSTLSLITSFCPPFFFPWSLRAMRWIFLTWHCKIHILIKKFFKRDYFYSCDKSFRHVPHPLHFLLWLLLCSLFWSHDGGWDAGKRSINNNGISTGRY